MKITYVLGVLCIVVLHVNAKTLTDEEKQAIRQMAADCRSTENASEQDVEDLIDSKIPDSKEGRCVAQCMMKQFNTIEETSEGSGQYKICKSCMTEMTAAGIEDEDKRQKVIEVIEACEPVSNPDRCEFAADVMKCFNDEAEKRGLSPEEF